MNDVRMTVGELIEKLDHFPEDMQVVFSSDQEGNGFYGETKPERHDNLVVLYPQHYSQDLDEFRDFKDDEDDE